jgi:hypothetical protein
MTAWTIDGLELRRRLGRDAWGVPRLFGPDGWVIDRKDRTARIIITASPAPGDTTGDGGEWLHASISGTDRLPTYEELCELHKAVWPDGYAYQCFVPPSQHVDIHPNALHLWGRPDGSAQLPEFGSLGTI